MDRGCRVRIRIGVNAGFGNPIGVEPLAQLHSALKFSVIRQDILSDDPFDIEHRLVAEFLPYSRPTQSLLPLWIVGSDYTRAHLSLDEIIHRAQTVDTICHRLQLPCAIEPMNEPDATSMSAHTFGNLVAGVAAVCPHSTIVSGGITSTSKRALAYLSEAATFIPLTAVIGFHSYRSGPPDSTLPGFSSRHEEFRELKSIAAGRRIWNTEVGWSDHEKHGGFIPSLCGRRLSQEEVADNLRREIEWNSVYGAEVLIVFQHRDGRGAQEHFGIFDIEGKPKRSAFVAQEG